MATNLQFLQKITSAGIVAQFDMNNIFDKGYDQYDIYVNLADGSTNGGYMGLRFFDSSNTIITASEYDWAGQEMKSYASFDNTWYAQNNDQIAPILVGTNDDHRGGGALIRVFNADDTSSYTFITAKSSTYMDSGGEGSQSIGVHKVTEKITGVRLDPQSVDMSLSATVYGVK